MKKDMIGAAVIILLVLLVAGIGLLSGRVQQDRGLESEVEQGILAVQQLDTKTVAEVEEIIESQEEEKRAEEAAEAAANDTRTLTEKYENAMVVGDSQALALSAYGILPDAKVAAKIALGVKNSDEYIETAISMNPSDVFMTFGLNDLGMYGTAEDFADVYGEKLEKLRKGLPDANIYVTAIFPCSQEAVERKPYLAQYTDYNAALQKKVEELGMNFIDCNSIVEDEYYQSDGQHFTVAFYELWAEYMAREAGL